MANEFVIKNGLKVQEGGIQASGSVGITGSLAATGGFIGNLTGSASTATSASYATYAASAGTATSATSATTATSASYATQALSASYSPGTNQSFQQVTDTGNTTTNSITVTGFTSNKVGGDGITGTFRSTNGYNRLLLISTGSTGINDGQVNIILRDSSDPGGFNNDGTISYGGGNTATLSIKTANDNEFKLQGTTTDHIHSFSDGGTGSLVWNSVVPFIKRVDGGQTQFLGLATSASYAVQADDATQVYVGTSTANTAFKLLFAANGAGNKDVLQDSEAGAGTYNPSTNTLTAGTFVGALSGNASTATTASFAVTASYVAVGNIAGTIENATSASYATYAASAGTATSATSATSASYATYAASAGTATSATSATNADNINVDEKNDNVNYQILFSDTNGSGYQRPYIDTDNTHLVYNPSTHTLTVGNIVVSGTTTTNNVEVVSTTNGVIFEGSAADNNEATLLAGTLTADRTIYLPDADGTIALTTSNITGNAATATSASYATFAQSAASATSATSATTATSASFASTAPFSGITGKPTLVSGSAQIDLSQTTGTAANATSASYATFATSAGSATSATTATTASFASTAPFTGITGKPALVSGSAQINLSQATGTAANATSASYATFAASAGSATSATSATSASYATFAQSAATATSATSATTATSASFASTAPFSGISGKPTLVSGSAQINLSQATGTAANATSASFAVTASYVEVGNISGTIQNAVSASYATFAASAGSATSATSATNATNIDISATTSTDTATSVVLVANQATGNQAPFIDSGLSYNANTNALTATTFVGALSGNATTATTASFASTAPFSGISGKPTLVSGSAQINLSQATGTAANATSASYATFAQSAATATSATSATSATTATSATSATTAATASSVSALGQNIVEIQNRLGVGTNNPFASIHIKSGSDAQLLIETDSPFDLGLGYSAGIRFKVEDTDVYDRAKGGIFFLNNSPNNEDWGRGDLILASNIDNSNTNVSTTDWRLKTDRDGHVHIRGNLIVTGSFSGAISSATSASYATFAASAGSATTATTSTNADNINISATTSTDTITSVVLVASQATGNQSPFIDSGLLYNANTNALTATTFIGALTGNADTATALTAGDKTVTGNLTVTGKVTAEEFHTEFVSSSIIFSSGSTKFGDDASDFHDFTGSLRLATLNNASTDTDKFLVTDGTTVKYRTGAQLLSDIGGQTSGTFVTDAGGSAGQVGVWSSDTAMSGSNGLYWSGSNLGVGTATPLAKTHIAGGADVLLVQGSGSTANTTLFAVDGNNGRLFEISDDLSDSLFSVNTIAGLPVIEAFADNTVTLGAYNQYDLHITGSKVGINNSAPAYELHVSGTVAATSVIETSARRFKEDIQPITDALNTVSQLQGVTFVRIGEENREYGFIADEVAGVAPVLASYDENGNPYGVQYARTVAILTEAVKELNTKVNSQELFIRDLLARIEKLENK